jgi:hypothetical protein
LPPSYDRQMKDIDRTTLIAAVLVSALISVLIQLAMH